MTVYQFLLSLMPASRAGAQIHPGGAETARRRPPQAPDPVPPASVLCTRVSARWMRQHRIGIEVRSSGQLAWVQSARVPVGRLVVHAESLSEADLLIARRLRAGHIVVGCPAQLAGLTTGIDPRRPQDVLLRSTDDPPAAGGARDGLDRAAAAQVIEHPLLHLAGLHADIGCRVGAFVSLPAAIGQMVADMAGLRDSHHVVLSRVSVGVESNADGADLTAHAADIQAALRDACHTFAFPLPTMIISTTTSTADRTAA